jgi:hypothetical protein
MPQVKLAIQHPCAGSMASPHWVAAVARRALGQIGHAGGLLPDEDRGHSEAPALAGGTASSCINDNTSHLLDVIDANAYHLDI